MAASGPTVERPPSRAARQDPSAAGYAASRPAPVRRVQACTGPRSWRPRRTGLDGPAQDLCCWLWRADRDVRGCAAAEAALATGIAGRGRGTRRCTALDLHDDRVARLDV